MVCPRLLLEPRKLIKKTAELIFNDAILKAVIEHYRDVGICSMLFGGGFWILNHIDPSGWGYISTVSGATLITIGVGALCLKARQAIRGIRELELHAFLQFVIGLLYSISLLPLLLAIVFIRK